VFERVQWSEGPSNFTYTQLPVDLRTEREKVAAAIESVQSKLSVGLQGGRLLAFAPAVKSDDVRKSTSSGGGSVSAFAADSMAFVFRDTAISAAASEAALATDGEVMFTPQLFAVLYGEPFREICRGI
jgi:hypothetical protein